MKKKGFTLIEMLSVIIILIALALLIIPTVGKYINEARTTGYTSQLKSIMTSVQEWGAEVENIGYLPSSIKGSITYTNAETLNIAHNYRELVLPLSYLQSVGAVDKNITNTLTNNLFVDNDLEIKIAYCGDKNWVYSVSNKGDTTVSSGTCSTYGLLTSALKKYVADHSEIATDGSFNNVSVSSLTSYLDDQYVNSFGTKVAKVYFSSRVWKYDIVGTDNKTVTITIE